MRKRAAGPQHFNWSAEQSGPRLERAGVRPIVRICFCEPDHLIAALEQGDYRLVVLKARDRIPAKSKRVLVDHFVRQP